MTRFEHDSEIQISDHGRTIAEVDVVPTDEPGFVHTELSVAAGHLPPGTRTRLVDAMLDHPDVDHADRMLATMPAGDTEMLDRVRERCDVTETRAAGASTLVEARLEHDQG
jgi:hypothetical protein